MIVNDKKILESFQLLFQMEGVIPALETAHAISLDMEVASKLDESKVIVINISGHSDNIMLEVAKELDINLYDDIFN